MLQFIGKAFVVTFFAIVFVAVVYAGTATLLVGGIAKVLGF